MNVRWLWLLVPLLGLVELFAHSYFSGRAPEPAAYAQVSAPLAKLHQPGDLVVMAPRWAEPNLRMALREELMPLAMVARPDDARYARAIEVSILGASTLPTWKVLSSERVGAFELRVLENPAPTRVQTELVDLFGTPRVEAASLQGSNERLCTWNPRARTSDGALLGHPSFPAQRFECGAAEWNFVGVTIIDDQEYRLRRCIWAAPAEKSSTVVRFKGVTLGNSIHGYGGLSYFLERESKGTPINLEAFVEGASLGVFTHNDGQGFVPFEFSTQHLAGQTHDVEFRVRSSKSRQRDFCFQADIR